MLGTSFSIAERSQQHNARLEQVDASVRDLDALPDRLTGTQVGTWIAALSKRPTTPLFDERGAPIDAATLDSLSRSINLGAVPADASDAFRAGGTSCGLAHVPDEPAGV